MMFIHHPSQDDTRARRLLISLRDQARRAQANVNARNHEIPTFPAGTISRAQRVKSAELWSNIEKWISEAVDKIEYTLEAD